MHYISVMADQCSFGLGQGLQTPSHRLDPIPPFPCLGDLRLPFRQGAKQWSCLQFPSVAMASIFLVVSLQQPECLLFWQMCWLQPHLGTVGTNIILLSCKPFHSKPFHRWSGSPFGDQWSKGKVMKTSAKGGSMHRFEWATRAAVHVYQSWIWTCV